MRQLTILPNADAARTLADHLLTLKIDTHLEKQPEGWAVWVRDEDHLPRARQELDEFTRNPNDPRYGTALQVADDLRQRKHQEERDYQRRQERFNRRMRGPVASQRWTVGLIVVCILVSLVSSGGNDRKIVRALSISPYRYTENVIEWQGMTPIMEGQVWRLVTPIFLHFGIWHLFFDMYVLYYLGGAVEQRRGPLRFLLLVLVIAVISNLVQYYFAHPVMDGPELKWIHLPNFGGMSGVNYGLFGYIWMKVRFQPELGFRLDPSIFLFLMICLVLGLTPILPFLFSSGVANGCHIGGLLCGMFLGYAPTVWRSARSE